MSVVERVAAMREQEGVRALGDALQSLNREREQLRQLQQYQADYRSSMVQRGRRGVRAVELVNYGEFLSQLDGMIEAQMLRISQAERTVAEVRQRWLGLRGRKQAVNNLVERFRAGEERQAGRREQAEMDDQFASRGRNRR